MLGTKETGARELIESMQNPLSKTYRLKKLTANSSVNFLVIDE